MATYWRGFADGITDWTQIALTSGHGDPAWSVVNTDQLQATSASSHNEALVWDDIDADSDRDDFEILCQIYVDSTSTTQRWIGGRISTSGASRTGYALRVRSNSIDTYRFNGSTYTVIQNGTFSVASGTWCWVRFRVTTNGGTNDVRARAWADGDAEPGTWQCDQQDATYSTVGHVGCIKGANTNTQLWRKFGVGTNGDTAPSSAGGTNYTKSISGSITSAGAFVRLVGKQLAGTTTSVGSAIKETSVFKTASITPASSVSSGGTLAQSVSGSITISGVLTDAVNYVRSYASSITLTGGLVNAISKMLSGTISLTGSVYKGMYVALSGAITALGSLSTFKFTPTIGERVNRGMRFLRRFIGRR